MKQYELSDSEIHPSLKADEVHTACSEAPAVTSAVPAHAVDSGHESRSREDLAYAPSRHVIDTEEYVG